MTQLEPLRLQGQPRLGLSRRAALGLLALPFIGTLPTRAEQQPQRIVCLDYGLTETLLMLGVKPIAVPNRESWEAWVVEPPLPPEIADIGTLMEPNLEFLQQLRPDIILSIPLLDGIKPLLERIAPVTSISIYAEDGRPYERSVAAIRQLAQLVGKVEEGETLIRETEAKFAEIRLRLEPLSERPIYVVSFLDPRNVRVYGRKSLFQDAFDRIGIRNAWTAETNYWGFSTVGIDGLAASSNARLAYLDPLPTGATGTLTESPVWNAMPFVRSRSILHLPPVLMFGALPSATRFAQVLADALTAENANG